MICVEIILLHPLMIYMLLNALLNGDGKMLF